jgi:glyoxylase-like metal-dependent hydrolase (beta-lactamase superfamily II)
VILAHNRPAVQIRPADFGARSRICRGEFRNNERMQSLSSGIGFIDLNFQQVPRIIATAVLHGPGGVALIDPGPSSALPALRRQLSDAGIAISDITMLLLTHIHLDHAGASGTLVREHPELQVYVHEAGAPHLVNPEKLLASATRLWGDEMDSLWGEVLPVPADRVMILSGGEQLRVGGRRLDVEHTPGHASHHVSYFCAESGLAFVGDTAGVRLAPQEFIMPPTPPPDIDIAQWHASLTKIAAWRPDTLFLTHFGPSAAIGAHLSEFRANLEMVATLAKTSLGRDGSDADREAWFVDELRQLLGRVLGSQEAAAYETANRLDLTWRGLARYWRKRV